MSRVSTSPMSWLLALAATVLAAFLLVYYVDLLQEAVARGSQFKYAQRSTVRQTASSRTEQARSDDETN